MFQKLKGDSVNLVALAAVCGVFFAAYQLHLGKSDSQAWSWLLSIASVSYTHLDVYKRQPLGLGRGLAVF